MGGLELFHQGIISKIFGQLNSYTSGRFIRIKRVFETKERMRGKILHSQEVLLQGLSVAVNFYYARFSLFFSFTCNVNNISFI